MARSVSPDGRQPRWQGEPRTTSPALLVGRYEGGPALDEPLPNDPFRPMASLLTDWLAAARLREVIHLVHLIRAELARRGVAFLWSLRQADPPAQDALCPSGERRVEV